MIEEQDTDSFHFCGCRVANTNESRCMVHAPLESEPEEPVILEEIQEWMQPVWADELKYLP